MHAHQVCMPSSALEIHRIFFFVFCIFIIVIFFFFAHPFHFWASIDCLTDLLLTVLGECWLFNRFAVDRTASRDNLKYTNSSWKSYTPTRKSSAPSKRYVQMFAVGLVLWSSGRILYNPQPFGSKLKCSTDRERKRERERVYAVCICLCVFVWVCVWMRGCVWEWVNERECVCVCDWERVYVCEWVCVRACVSTSNCRPQNEARSPCNGNNRHMESLISIVWHVVQHCFSYTHSTCTQKWLNQHWRQSRIHRHRKRFINLKLHSQPRWPISMHNRVNIHSCTFTTVSISNKCPQKPTSSHQL